MIVYRVANENGHGPYISSNLTRAVKDALEPMYDVHWGAHHPTPDFDHPGHFIREDEICAFSSQTQLLDWFDGFEELLDSLGFRVYEFNVPDWAVTELRHQTIICTGEMVCVNAYTLV